MEKNALKSELKKGKQVLHYTVGPAGGFVFHF